MSPSSADVPHVNLLLLSDGEKQHYCLIKNLSRLIAQRSSHPRASHACVYCLHVFCRADLLAEHVPHCKTHGPQRVKMPSGDDATIHFHHEDHPGYKSTPVVYRGPDVVDHFLESLRHEHRLINSAIDCPVPMTMTPADIEDFASATTCHICRKDATRMVRDHEDFTGAYRGAAHNKCNLRLHVRGRRRAAPTWRFPSYSTTCGVMTPTLSPQPSVATPVTST